MQDFPLFSLRQHTDLICQNQDQDSFNSSYCDLTHVFALPVTSDILVSLLWCALCVALKFCPPVAIFGVCKDVTIPNNRWMLLLLLYYCHDAEFYWPEKLVTLQQQDRLKDVMAFLKGKIWLRGNADKVSQIWQPSWVLFLLVVLCFASYIFWLDLRFRMG